MHKLDLRAFVRHQCRALLLKRTLCGPAAIIGPYVLVTAQIGRYAREQLASTGVSIGVMLRTQRLLWRRAEVNFATARSIVQERQLPLAENERLRTFIDIGVHPGQTVVRPSATER